MRAHAIMCGEHRLCSPVPGTSGVKAEESGLPWCDWGFVHHLRWIWGPLFLNQCLPWTWGRGEVHLTKPRTSPHSPQGLCGGFTPSHSQLASGSPSGILHMVQFLLFPGSVATRPIPYHHLDFPSLNLKGEMWPWRKTHQPLGIPKEALSQSSLQLPSDPIWQLTMSPKRRDDRLKE